MSFTSSIYSQAAIEALTVENCCGNSSPDAQISADAATMEGLTPTNLMSTAKRQLYSATKFEWF